MNKFNTLISKCKDNDDPCKSEGDSHSLTKKETKKGR